MNSRGLIVVFGPAYLDRVLRVDRPLLPGGGPPLDRSVEALHVLLGIDDQLRIVDPSGREIRLALPADWPGPRGELRLRDSLGPPDCSAPWTHSLEAVAWHDDLGGIGAGYAKALGARLVSALGGEDDPMSRQISALLASEAIRHEPVRRAGTSADWTLLVTSGPHADKLPIGFRGCHAALHVEDLASWDLARAAHLVVVAGLPNRLAQAIFHAVSDNLRPTQTRLEPEPRPLRVFAPTMRNTRDDDPPIRAFAEQLDVVSANAEEWENLAEPDRRALELHARLTIETRGARGAMLVVKMSGTDRRRVFVEAFPRTCPPRDTNRAGETFTTTLLRAMIESPEPAWVASPAWWQAAGRRAAAAAAVVLDRDRFGFPGDLEIEQALREGVVPAGGAHDHRRLPDPLPLAISQSNPLEPGLSHARDLRNRGQDR
jgi:ribokinase